MNYYKIITKLIGSVQPSGDASIDPQRKESFLKTIELVDQLLNDIRSAAVSKDRYEASMKEIGVIAHNYLSGLEPEITKPYSGMKVKIVANTAYHKFEIGEIVTLKTNTAYEEWRASNDNDCWYINKNDFEILEQQ